MKQIVAKCFLGVVFLWTVCKSDSLSVFPANNCTCVTSDGGVYSLWPLRRTDGKPRFLVPGGQYPGWRYTYNPCTPVDVGQDDPTASQICKDVALCKFAEIEKPRQYFEIGLQKDFDCEINEEGQIQLVYRTHDRTIDIPHSSVIFLCDEDATIPVFKTEDEDNYIFSITHYCACRNRCPPGQKFEISSSKQDLNTAIHWKQQSKTPGDSSIVPAMVGLGVIVSVSLGVFMCWKYRGVRQPSESRQTLLKETRKREKNMFI